MYIEKYWEVSVGGSDDTMSLLDYLEHKQKSNITIGEIFSDIGLSKLNGNFRQTTEPLVIEVEEGFEVELHYAIDLISVLAALLLECKVNGSINLQDLDPSKPNFEMHIAATPDEHQIINNALNDFVKNPNEYDLLEMMMEDELQDMLEGCEKLGKELYG